MTIVSDVMTREVKSIGPGESVRKAAEIMEGLNVGALVICEGQKLVGFLTDRDIVVRAVSRGREPSCQVSEIASVPVHWCFDDDQLADVQLKMREFQIRRLPVVDRKQRLVGMLSLADIAALGRDISKTVRAISQSIERDPN